LRTPRRKKEKKWKNLYSQGGSVFLLVERGRGKKGKEKVAKKSKGGKEEEDFSIGLNQQKKGGVSAYVKMRGGEIAGICFVTEGGRKGMNASCSVRAGGGKKKNFPSEPKKERRHSSAIGGRGSNKKKEEG